MTAAARVLDLTKTYGSGDALVRALDLDRDDGPDQRPEDQALEDEAGAVDRRRR